MQVDQNLNPENPEESKFVKNLEQLFFALIVLVINSVIGAYMFMKLWEWFITFAFKIDPITPVESLGVIFTLSYLRLSARYTPEEEVSYSFSKAFQMIWDKLIRAASILGLAYLITLLQAYN